MLREQPHSLLVRVVGQRRLLRVAEPLGLLRQRVVVCAHRPRRDRFAHAPLEHHRARDLRHLLEVAGGAVRDAAEDELLGGTAGERDDHPVEELLLRLEVALLLGQVEDVAERRPARDDRRLLRLVADEVAHQRVTALVVGEDPLLLLGHDAALLEAGDDPFHRGVEVDLADLPLLGATGKDRRLDCRQPFLGARYLDEEVGLVAALAEIAAQERCGMRAQRQLEDAIVVHDLFAGRHNGKQDPGFWTVAILTTFAECVMRGLDPRIHEARQYRI